MVIPLNRGIFFELTPSLASFVRGGVLFSFILSHIWLFFFFLNSVGYLILLVLSFQYIGLAKWLNALNNVSLEVIGSNLASAVSFVCLSISIRNKNKNKFLISLSRFQVQSMCSPSV